MRRSRLVILSVIAMVVVLTVGAISIGGSAGRVLGADDKAVQSLLIAQQAPSAEGDSSSVNQTPSQQDAATREDYSKIDYKVYSPNAFKVNYLGLDGNFTIDPTEVSATDPRNPKRVVFSKMEFFSFYDDLEGKTPIAQNCRYLYKGAAGDPFYYPKESKTSIWDLFELVSKDDACQKFYYVTLRSPHAAPGEPLHIHMRYGDANSSFRTVLNISTLGPEDKTKIDPWWSVYCTEGESGCDK